MQKLAANDVEVQSSSDEFTAVTLCVCLGLEASYGHLETIHEDAMVKATNLLVNGKVRILS